MKPWSHSLPVLKNHKNRKNRIRQANDHCRCNDKPRPGDSCAGLPEAKTDDGGLA